MPYIPSSSPSVSLDDDPTSPDPLSTNEKFGSPTKEAVLAAQDSRSHSLGKGIALQEPGSASPSDFPSPPSVSPTLLSASRSPGYSNLTEFEDPGKLLLLDSIPRTNIEVRLPKSTLVNPKSRFSGWTPPAPITKEYDAVANLMRILEAETDIYKEDFIEFELDQFSVYVHSQLYPYELRPLQHLCTRSSSDTFYFDGILAYGDSKYYVERVPFQKLPIGNYRVNNPTVGDQIWIQSRRNEGEKPERYYKLRKPAPEYERFHTGFLWIADLAKHVVDFCEHLASRNRPVALADFQQKFIIWLQEQDAHKTSPEFQKWRCKHPSDDYRTSVVANMEFIWKEVYGSLGEKFARSLQLFREIKNCTQYKPFAPVSDEKDDISPTIVTPYIHKCFMDAEYGSFLTPIAPRHGCQNPDPVIRPDKALIKTNVSHGGKEPAMRSDTNSRRRSMTADPVREMIGNIKPGDTISTPQDDAKFSKWKAEVAKSSVEDEPRWFGLVQKVHVSQKGARSFDVIWLYRPVDTPCCRMVYPWSNELFLSDHCNCEGSRTEKVDEDEVLAVHTVTWFGDPESTTELFVRQTYQAEHRRWVTLASHHMKCQHDKPEKFAYKAGDTVLATLTANEERTEPCEIVKIFKQGQNKFVRLRRLLRRAEVDPHAHAHAKRNEVVYTDDKVVLKAHEILGGCIVRFFRYDESIPTPYDRDGTANIFFMTHKLDENHVCVPLDEAPPTMRQGFNPKPKYKVPKLRGLDLFCGSGNFGRGLEEGGVVDMCWANDIWDKALHSYMANSSKNTKGLLGSVDDFLQHVLEGNYGDFPRPGQVDIISGGSPCQGFSLITNDKKADKQKKNRSLVASFASFVDFYRPKYVILENVLNIVQTTKGREDDAFSQLICALVGIGYQTQIVLGDAWAYGAPQSRSRVFLIFAAPGFRLPDPPRPSHSHPPGVKGRSLGKTTSGEAFVSRSLELALFKFVSAGEATADLPCIHDAKADCSVGFPDHRISKGVTEKARLQQNRIPTHPYGINFWKAWNEGKGVMTTSERALFPPTGLRVTSKVSKGWGRINPGGLFQTVTTCLTPTDARVGTLMHWNDDRPITILEARRAQGFLDHEVLVGSPVDQYHLVGNSVARPMALALGLAFRKVWLGTLYDDTIVPIAVEEAPRMAPDLALVSNVKIEEGIDWNDCSSLSAGTSDLQNAGQFDGSKTRTPTASTPPTSVSETDTKLAVGSRKRPLWQALGDDLVASKRQRVEEQQFFDPAEN